MITVHFCYHRKYLKLLLIENILDYLDISCDDLFSSQLLFLVTHTAVIE